MPLNRKQATSGLAYPVGEYSFEIKDLEKKTGVNQDTNEKWESIRVYTEIITPENLYGRKYSFTCFYGGKLLRLLFAAQGNQQEGFDAFLNRAYEGKEDLEDSKIFSMLKGSFFRAKLGIKGGYNEIAEYLPNLNAPNVPEEKTI